MRHLPFKTRMAAAVCLILILAFSACAPSAAPETAASDPPAVSQSDAPTVDAVRASLHMEMALPSMGAFSGEIASNENGAYAILSGTEDWSGRLIYYDYATRQLIWLSDQMVVTNDEENPGWLEDTFGGAAPMAANGQLYEVKYGKAPVPGIGYEGSPSYLLRMEPNAANRQKLTVPQGKLLYTGSGIAADGEELYLILADYDAQKMEQTGFSLCQTDFANGRYETLLPLTVYRSPSLKYSRSRCRLITRVDRCL